MHGMINIRSKITLSSIKLSSPPPTIHSFPTRRSSDLHRGAGREAAVSDPGAGRPAEGSAGRAVRRRARDVSVRHDELLADRKSTRLNSSHSQISYAVFCLKKKRLKHLACAVRM